MKLIIIIIASLFFCQCELQCDKEKYEKHFLDCLERQHESSSWITEGCRYFAE